MLTINLKLKGFIPVLKLKFLPESAANKAVGKNHIKSKVFPCGVLKIIYRLVLYYSGRNPVVMSEIMTP